MDISHYCLYTVGHLRNLMAAAGMDVVRIFPYNDWKPRTMMGRMLLRFVPWLNYPRLWLEARRPVSLFHLFSEKIRQATDPPERSGAMVRGFPREGPTPTFPLKTGKETSRSITAGGGWMADRRFL